jgi:hypothetical protein
MANISFGLDINENAKTNGYDLYKSTLGETLGAVAEDAWNFNPLPSAIRFFELEANRNEDTNEPLISRDELNKKYSNLDLFFDQDEKQSTVDILVNRKTLERERQSIIARGPEGSFNPFNSGFYTGGAKLGTSLAVSIADPINIASAFIPVVGEARFASLVARQGLTKARGIRGVVEGAVGAAAVEPIVLTAATAEQADYGLMDSFLNVTFGSIIGGGLHIGAGALKDFRTRRAFEDRVEAARNAAGITDGEDPAVNLYKEYYPETSRVMKELAETDPETRRLLLTRALADLIEDNPVNVKPIADLDPKLREAQINDAVPVNERVNTARIVDENIGTTERVVTEDNKGTRVFKKEDELDIIKVEDVLRQKDIDQRNLDLENRSIEDELNIIKNRQKDLDIEESAELKQARTESQEVVAKEKELKDAIKDGINCVNGR